MTRLDTLAEQLGRARQAHERRPDDRVLELRLYEAQVAFLSEQLRLKEEERRRGLVEVAALRRELRALQDTIGQKIARALESVREAPKPRRRRGTAAVSAPLFEGRA
ncbi:hypothetical protein [Methylopila sp. M107]|uniref:hypothetical protein n=1 Tax=Methylopila sp. M107 TaxID=1101190 RepID=UPI00036A745F|nr:hypothetical protein [Methylopila sp. M107]